MHEITNLEMGKSVLEANQRLAEENHEKLKRVGIKSYDFMGAIGSGKTEIIIRLAERLKKMGKCVGVITGDVAGNDDYKRVKSAGIDAVVNVNTGKECHLDAHLVDHAIEELLNHNVDILFIENVGNLVCPADFPLGTDMRVVIVSVTEGDDMVRKHPVIFGLADIAVINKIDIAQYVGVNVDTIITDYKKLKPHGVIITTNAKNGDGIDELGRVMGLW